MVPSASWAPEAPQARAASSETHWALTFSGGCIHRRQKSENHTQGVATRPFSIGLSTTGRFMAVFTVHTRETIAGLGRRGRVAGPRTPPPDTCCGIRASVSGKPGPAGTLGPGEQRPDPSLCPGEGSLAAWGGASHRVVLRHVSVSVLATGSVLRSHTAAPTARPYETHLGPGPTPGLRL